MKKDKWSSKNWDKSLKKSKDILEAQYPEAKCEVWLTGAACNGTEYCDNLQLNVRVELDYSIEKYWIPITNEAQEHIKNTDDYLMLATGAALKSIQNLIDKR